MECLPSELFGISFDAGFDAVSGLRVPGFVVPPSVFLRSIGNDRSVIQPNEVDATLRLRATADPRRPTTQGQQFVLLQGERSGWGKRGKGG